MCATGMLVLLQVRFSSHNGEAEHTCILLITCVLLLLQVRFSSHNGEAKKRLL
jgi:hypothetical protein